MTTLVNIRCAKHRTVLASVDSAPTDWSGSLVVPVCRRCYEPAPHRRDRVVIEKWAEGKGGLATEFLIPWEDLRGHIAEAWRKGKTVDFPVRVTDPPPEQSGRVLHFD